MDREITDFQLTTEYENELDRSSPYPEYPRPQFRRESFFSLNGEWEFEISESPEIPKGFGERILVPFPMESRISGIGRTHKPAELMFYRTRFTLPKGFLKDRVLLNFGAADQLCTVFLNGDTVWDGYVGYLPISIDVTDSLKAENELTVRVKDTLDKKYPYGKQSAKRGGMWYTPVSGIWQTVWLESVSDGAFEKIEITPTVKDVKIKVYGGKGKKRLTLEGELYEFSGDEITLSPKEKRLWTPENPNLYYFTLECDADKIESYFALREISVGEAGGVKRILLNGKPYFFNALLDQGYYPDGIFLPATARGYEEDITLAKSLGFNTLRKHIKIEPLIFYHLCDKLGMVVFQDMVNNSDYSFIRDTAMPTLGIKVLPDKNMHKNPESREIFLKTMLGTIKHLYNVPSVLYYTLFNEGWGQFSADEVYKTAKSADKTRIIDSTSGWFIQSESDVDSHHIYFKRIKPKIPKKRPAVISEFGGYSYRARGHLFGSNNYGYRSFGTKEELEDAIVALYLDEIKPYVKLGLSGAVLTQISDVEDETNGLVTYDRRLVKINPERIRRVMDELTSENK